MDLDGCALPAVGAAVPLSSCDQRVVCCSGGSVCRFRKIKNSGAGIVCRLQLAGASKEFEWFLKFNRLVKLASKKASKPCLFFSIVYGAEL